MKKRLIDSDDEQYNSAGLEFSKEFSACIDSIVDRWAAEGYSLRDMQVVMQTEVSVACLSRLSEERLAFRDY